MGLEFDFLGQKVYDFFWRGRNRFKKSWTLLKKIRQMSPIVPKISSPWKYPKIPQRIKESEKSQKIIFCLLDPSFPFRFHNDLIFKYHFWDILAGTQYYKRTPSPA